MKIHVIGVGMGPQHITGEAAEALRNSDYVVASQKSDTDELLAIRRQIATQFGLPVVAVPDPARADGGDYQRAVSDWHAARVAAYRQVLAERGGTSAFLVWGDPALYDSTIRIVDELARHFACDFDVIPGISAPQLLAARHRIVLHEIGQPVLVTTARRLAKAIDAANTNICVMLSSGLEWSGLDDWSIWWGANLGTASEELVSGLVRDVRSDIDQARERSRTVAGWVMDICLLRAP